jgi:small multidrug resistance pump
MHCDVTPNSKRQFMRFDSPDRAPDWMFRVLWFAGLYNLAFGAWVVLTPRSLFSLIGMSPPTPILIWQCVGMIVGVYGVGYICAAYSPLRHWPIVLVGLLGKILGPIGFCIAARRGDLPWKFGWVNVTNDLIWWLPFVIILARAWRYAHSTPHRWFG